MLKIKRFVSTVVASKSNVHNFMNEIINYLSIVQDKLFKRLIIIIIFTLLTAMLVIIVSLHVSNKRELAEIKIYVQLFNTKMKVASRLNTKQLLLTCLFVFTLSLCSIVKIFNDRWNDANILIQNSLHVLCHACI